MGVSPRQITALALLVIAAPLSGTLIGVTIASDLPTYKPPSRGAPSTRVGGGTRSMPPAARQIVVFAPDHTGLTTRAQPSLYWYLSKPATTRVEITSINRQAENLLLGLSVASPSSAGVQKLDLANHGVRLQPGVQYRWHVSLALDPLQRSNSGAIERIEASPELAKRLQATPRAGQGTVYAEEGIWYDAMASIGDLIEQFPNDAALRTQRASLLEQIGLKEAAASDLRR